MADAQVIAWLRCAGLSRFAPRFAAALISPNIFLSLAPSDLDALGVDSPADRKRLSDLIADLRRTSDLSPPAAPPPPTRSSTIPSVRHHHHHHHHHSSSLHPRHVLESLPDRNSPFSSAAHIGPHKHHRSHSSSASAGSASFTATTSTAAATASARRHGQPTAATTTPAASSTTRSPFAMRDATATVTVCVRKRPLSRKELSSSDRDIVSVNAEDASLYVHELKEKVDLTKYVETHSFSFDNVFGEHVSNAAVYNGTARPLVDTLFGGGRGTCFAYGQTGAGKTFTMAGDGARNPGLYTLAVKDVFDRIRDIESDLWRKAEEDGIEDFEPPDPPQVWISFYEIYASRLQDLLNRGAKLECREDANNEVKIVGLTERLCEVEEDVLALIDRGSALRSTGCTGANDDSSRSHAVFQIELRDPPPEEENVDMNAVMRESLLRGSGARAPPSSSKGEEIGRLCFIDLAGSERGSDTASSTRQTRMEGAEINKSLLALKECIRAMDKKKDHTPFRGSKLTQVLKASFLGKNCRTVMIANISPASSNVEHTLNTLRYSDRVKEIKRERGSSNSGADHGPKSFGARRATFSHGIGGTSSSRSSRSTYANFPTLPRSTTGSTENESPDELSSSQLGMKLDRVGLSGDDMDDLPTKPPRPDATRRTKSRARARISEIQPSAAEPTQRIRETRLMRRRTSKVSQLPQRPSMGGTMLPRPPLSKAGPPDRMTRTMSARTDRISPATSPDGDTESSSLSRPSKRSARGRDRDPRDRDRESKPTPPSPALTRGRARQLEMMRDDAHSSEHSMSDAHDDEDSADQSDDTRTETASTSSTAVTRKRAPRASNVAESAMKYYMTKKTEELPEEDLLFASSDDLFDDESNKRLLLASTEDRPAAAGPPGRPKPRGGAGAPAATDKSSAAAARDHAEKKAVGVSERRKRDTDGSDKEDTSAANGFKMDAATSKVAPAPATAKDAGEGSDPLRSVIRMHHMQIEELMRLTEADVALVNAAENGEMDAQEYALKLGLNLSQKLDIVRTLQSKLKALV